MEDKPYISAEELAERWPIEGDSLGRWRDQLRRWRCAPEPLLRAWKDYHIEAVTVSPGRYPYTYRLKRVVYLLLTEQTILTSELRLHRVDDLRAVYNRLLQMDPPPLKETGGRSVEDLPPRP